MVTAGGSETITDAGRNTEVAALGNVIYFICTAGRHGETWQPTCRVSFTFHAVPCAQCCALVLLQLGINMAATMLAIVCIAVRNRMTPVQLHMPETASYSS